MSSVQHLAHLKSELFPVASLLLAPAARAPLRICYDFLRGADEIADNPTLPADERLRQLEALRCAPVADIAAVWATRFSDLCQHDSTYHRLAMPVLDAFAMDCAGRRYDDMAALIDYCQHSAVPVGQMVLHACREPATPALLTAANALCCTLQLLNHVRDIHKDYVQLGRIYLPQQWMRRHGVMPEMLAQHSIFPPLAMLIEDLLKEISALLEQAAALPLLVSSPGLRRQCAWCLHVARRWHRTLSRRTTFHQCGHPRLHELCFCFIAGLWS